MIRSPVQFQVHSTERMTKRNRSHGLLMSITDDLGRRRHQLAGSIDEQLLDDRKDTSSMINTTTMLSLHFEQNSDNESLPHTSSATHGTGPRWPNVSSTKSILITPTTTRSSLDSVGSDDTRARIVFELATPPPSNSPPGSEEALLNRSSVLFVAVSFILLMVISLAWLVFYYVQRFRYLHSKERVSRRLAELAKKAVARIPIKTLHPGDRETNSDLDQCAICIEPFRPLDNIRVLPCRHYFHKLCIDPWLLEQRSCPMCKLDILQAYGLRSEFFFGYPNAENGPSRASDNATITASGLGAASTSGSDDGMERIALVHSHSRSTLAPVSPPLTYMVLAVTSATTTDGSVVVSAADSTTKAMITTDATRLYVRGSDSSDTTNGMEIAQPTLQDLPNTAIPLQASAHNIIVSLLPHLSPSSSSVVQSHPPRGLVTWTPELSVTVDTTVPTSITCSNPSVLSDGSGSTSSYLVYSIPPPTPTTIVSSSCATRQTLTSAITSTTQILVAPLCSVRAEHGPSVEGSRCPGNDNPGECDIIAPVARMEMCGNLFDHRTTVPGDVKHELLYPHRSKPAPTTAQAVGRLWRRLIHPFRVSSRSTPASLTFSTPGPLLPNTRFSDQIPQIYSSVHLNSSSMTTHNTTEQHVVVAVVESAYQPNIQQHQPLQLPPDFLSVIPTTSETVYSHTHDSNDSSPRDGQS